MKLSRHTALVAVALSTFALAGQDSPVLLRLKLAPNTTDAYKLDTAIDEHIVSQVMGDVPMKMSVSALYTVKTGAVDPSGKSAAVDTTMSVSNMTMDGPMGQNGNQPQVKPVTTSGTIDNRGRLTVLPPKAGDMMTLMMAGSQGSTEASEFVSFPKGPVKVGDTWNIKVPKSLFTGPNDQTLTATLVGSKQFHGHDVWEVSVTGLITSAFDSSKLPASATNTSSPLSQLHFIVKGKVQLKGDGLVDKGTGKTVSMTYTGKMRSTIDLPDQGQNMDSSGTLNTNMVLQGY